MMIMSHSSTCYGIICVLFSEPIALVVISVFILPSAAKYLFFSVRSNKFYVVEVFA